MEVVVSEGKIAAPAAGQLYLLQRWCGDAKGLRHAGVPRQVSFATKPDMALVLLEQLCRDGVQKTPVLADSLYGDCSAFREGVRQLGLEFFVQVTPTAHTAWAEALRLIKKLKRSYPAADQPQAQTLLQIATGWPQGDAQPYHCYLADLKNPPQKLPCLRLSRARWHVEQYFQRSKQDLGLDHYEGRFWRGFHHHLILSVLAYLFVTLKHLRSKKNFWRLCCG